MAKIPRKGPRRAASDPASPTDDYVVGFGRPPASGRIKQGEVRNPYGRNGKSAPRADPFEKAMNRPATFT